MLVAVMLVTAACVTVQDGDPGARRPAPTQYTVIPGDTLWGIAFRQRLDWRDLARWNGIDDPSLIHPGQVLRLTPPGGSATASAGKRAASAGSGPKVTAPRTASAPSAQSTGRAARGAPAGSGGGSRQVASAPDAASSSGIRWGWPGGGGVVAGFGDPASVGRGIDIGGQEGDSVTAAASGRVVYSGSGLIGYGNLVIIKHDDTYLSAYGHNSRLLVEQGDEVRAGQRIALMGLGPGRKPLLHFEIRKDGDPVDPMQYLPAR